MPRLNIQIAKGSGHRRGWMKWVTGVDQSKSNGFAFSGEFLREGEQDLPVGAVVVEQYPTGSVKHGINKGEAFMVSPEGDLVSFVTCANWRTEFLSFRDAIAAKLQELQSEESKKETLLAEKEQLLARLAEINQLLGE